MKKILIIFTLLVSAISFTKAQGGGGGFNQGTPAERAERSFTRLPATLNLTADQKTKILAVYVAQAKPQDSLIATMQQGGDRAAMMAKFTELTAATDAKILALLTGDQKTAYQEYVKARPAFGGRGGGQGGGGAAGGGGR